MDGSRSDGIPGSPRAVLQLLAVTPSLTEMFRPSSSLNTGPRKPRLQELAAVERHDRIRQVCDKAPARNRSLAAGMRHSPVGAGDRGHPLLHGAVQRRKANDWLPKASRLNKIWEDARYLRCLFVRPLALKLNQGTAASQE